MASSSLPPASLDSDNRKRKMGQAFDDMLEPEWYLMPLSGYKFAGVRSLRVQQIDVKCETKTKDNVFVNVVASIQYRAMAEKAADAFYKLSDSRAQIHACVFDVIRAAVPKLNLDAAFEEKNYIAKAIEDELEKAMSAYGFEIVQTLIVDIEPANCAKKAMNEIIAERKMGQAFDDMLKPELYLMPLSGYKFADVRSLRVQQIDVKCETKTKDNVFVNVVASILYRAMAEKAADAFYKLSDSRAQIHACVFDVIRAAVPKLNLDAAFEEKNYIAKAIEDELEKAMSAYGFEIVQTLIVDIELANCAEKAMNEINADSSCGSNGNPSPGFWDSTSRYPHVKYHRTSQRIKAGSQDGRLQREIAMSKKQLKEEKSKSKALVERIITLERMAGSQDVRLQREIAMLKKQLKKEKSKSKAFLERIITLERMVKHIS